VNRKRKMPEKNLRSPAGKKMRTHVVRKLVPAIYIGSEGIATDLPLFAGALQEFPEKGKAEASIRAGQL